MPVNKLRSPKKNDKNYNESNIKEHTMECKYNLTPASGSDSGLEGIVDSPSRICPFTYHYSRSCIQS
jgi:hypothetical protein